MHLIINHFITQTMRLNFIKRPVFLINWYNNLILIIYETFTIKKLFGFMKIINVIFPLLRILNLIVIFYGLKIVVLKWFFNIQNIMLSHSSNIVNNKAPD